MPGVHVPWGSPLGRITGSHCMLWTFKGNYIPDLYDMYDLYDLAHVTEWEPCNVHGLARVSWVGFFYLYYTDPAQQPLTTAGEDLDDLDRDISDFSVAQLYWAGR